MARSRNQITTGRIGGVVYDLRHWKLTLFVAIVWGLPRLVCRVVSGRNLIGGGRDTDATFLRAAYGVRGSWWGNQRGVLRAGVRLLALVLFALWFNHPAVAYIGLGVTAVVVGYRFYRHFQRVVHEKLMLRPVWPAVAGIIGVPVEEPPSRWLDIPRSMAGQEPPADARIMVGLRAADNDDERRVRDLVQLFTQRFGARHVGTVDYAARLVSLRRRPAEPRIWPAVAAVLGVSPDDLADDWLTMPDNFEPGAQVHVRLPDDVVDDTPLTDDLKRVVSQNFTGEWTARAIRGERERAVVVTRKAPAPKPPKRVDWASYTPPSAHQEVN
jgi:hypothetical protein